MPDTYTLLEKVTVGSGGASSVTFTNIPQSYTDLKIVASVRSNRAGAINSFMRLYPNGNSTGITYRALFGTGSAASSFTESTASQYVGEINATDSTSNTFSNTEIYIPNYTSGAQKSYSIDFVIENNATLAYMGLIGELWANTSAITSIQLLDGLANFVQYSTFYLYGVAKQGVTPLSAPKATGGDIIVSDGTYWIHTFLSSGTFRPLTSLTCDYLVVAGGGGGGFDAGGGGGAGGYRNFTSAGFTASTNYTVTVGAGGAGSTNTNNKGTNGSASTFNSNSATGGGGGGSSSTVDGANGGSGGGERCNATGSPGTGNLGGYSPSEGNNGGGALPGDNIAGGGGGHGAVGVAGGNNSGTAGYGGVGTSNSISGTAVIYASGGGGAFNGTVGQGGGRGGSASGGGTSGYPAGTPTSFGNGTNGTGNLGTGGGGGGNGGSGGAGGSGIVIVRYAV